MHGLTGYVPVDPALHGGPGDLESGGDLADRPALVNHELGNLEAVTWSKCCICMSHGDIPFGCSDHPEGFLSVALGVVAQRLGGEAGGFGTTESGMEV